METKKQAIGIDMGGSHIRIGLVCEDRIVDSVEFKVEASKGLTPYMSDLKNGIDSLVRKSRGQRIDGVGISFPGLVDVGRKRPTATFGKYDDISEIDLEKWFANNWACPYFIDLDARMSAIGEWKQGAGVGYDSLVMMTLGTGIGTAVINEGAVLRGKHFQAGSFGGHFIVDLDGPSCSCGGRGCIEAHTGSWSIDLQARTNPDFSSSALSDCSSSIGYRELFEAADAGDVLASRLKEKSLRVWAAGIVSYIHAYDPELVILGGSVMKNADQVLPFIQQFVDKYAVTPWGKVKVVSGMLLDDSAILGAVQCLVAGI